MQYLSRNGGPSEEAAIWSLPAPGQVSWPVLPRELLSNAPWLFVVYLGFHDVWTPIQIIFLVLALTPLTVVNSWKRA